MKDVMGMRKQECLPPFFFPFYQVELDPVQVFPLTLSLNFGCALSSTFLSPLLSPSLLPPGFLSSYFGRTLTGSLSLCEAEVSSGTRIPPTQTSTQTHPREPRACTDTQARTHTRARLSTSLPGEPARVPTFAAHSAELAAL